jgi:opine dehydrogenase
MSANRIEYTKGEFWMYREAFTPSIWNLIKQLDKEKNDVIEKFGGERINYLDACKFRNESDLSKDSLSVFNSYAEDGGPKGPATIYGRYLFEDVANGLVLLKSLGKKVGIDTPICDALITIASALVNEDFEQNGHTLKNLHLDHLSAEELISFFNY